MPQRRQRSARVAQEDLAVTGDLDAAPFALENRNAQNLFKLADRLRDRRLRHMQEFGCLHDALLARDLDKCQQMAKLNASVYHVSHNSLVKLKPRNIILPNQMKHPVLAKEEI